MVRVTGVGSLPGSDFGGAVRATVDLLPEFAYLPELPDRGPRASMVGRATGLLPGLAAGLFAGQWQLADHPGLDQRRARATLRDDLDRLEEAASDYRGPFKVAVAGPWTLAASIFLPRGGRVLGDRAARSDVAASWAEGVAELRAEVTRRVPAAEVILQVDEPALPAVLAGAVPTEGGYFRHRSIDRAEVVAALRPAAAGSVLHCCAPSVPLALLAGPGDTAGFAAVSVDQDLIEDWDAIARLVDVGAGLYLGAVPTGTTPTPDQLAARVLRVLRPLELGPQLADRLVLTPACGLAGSNPRDVTALFKALIGAASVVDSELR